MLMKLSLAVQTPEVEPHVPVALLSGSLEEKFAKAALWGADGVELMTVNPRLLNWQDISNTIEANRLKVSAIASGAMGFAAGITLLNASREVMALAKSRLYDLIDFAAAMHAPVVTIGSFRGRLSSLGSDGFAKGQTLLMNILGEAAAYAAQHSVLLALEAANRYELDFIHNHEQALEFAQAVNQPALGVLLDTFHMNIEEASWDVPFEQTFAAGKLFHVHLGDNNRLPTGRGMIDFPHIVKTLHRLDYTGYLSAELLALPDADTAAQQTLAYMRPLLES
jgi:sugar phosphate isomerase/epimerase